MRSHPEWQRLAWSQEWVDRLFSFMGQGNWGITPCPPPKVGVLPLRMGLSLNPQVEGWSILILAPFRASPSVSWRSCLAPTFWKGLKEILEVGPAGRWGQQFGAGGPPAGPALSAAFRTHALDAGMSKELWRKCWQDNRASGGTRWAWTLGIRPSVNVELAWLGPGREDDCLGALGDLREQFPVARGDGFWLVWLRGPGTLLEANSTLYKLYLYKVVVFVCVCGWRWWEGKCD